MEAWSVVWLYLYLSVSLYVSVCVCTARDLWRFLKHVTKDVHQLSEYVSRDQDKVTLLLKKAPDK